MMSGILDGIDPVKLLDAIYIRADIAEKLKPGVLTAQLVSNDDFFVAASKNHPEPVLLVNGRCLMTEDEVKALMNNKMIAMLIGAFLK